MKKFFTYNFGCRVNQAELRDLEAKLLFNGYVKSDEKPDFIIINTCTVTDKAEKQCVQFIRSLKNKNPYSKIYIIGCASVLWKNYDNIYSLIDNKDIQQASLLLDKYSLSSRDLIKIQNGCDQFCSYCLVPFLRNNLKSEFIKNIIKRINNNQPKEVILTAINSDLYGKDTGEQFSKLIKEIIKIENISRISFGSLNINSFNKSVIKLFTHPKMIKAVHLPIQSGSNKILRLMNRPYRSFLAKHTINNLFKISPSFYISTDIIVGFPGESDKDFAQTINFLQSNPISKIHVFRYSRRLGTKAALMKNQISDNIKKDRADLITNISNKKYFAFINSLIGYQSQALFLKERKGNYSQALLDNNIPVLINTNKDFTGKIIKIIVTKRINADLYGKIIND